MFVEEKLPQTGTAAPSTARHKEVFEILCRALYFQGVSNGALPPHSPRGEASPSALSAALLRRADPPRRAVRSAARHDEATPGRVPRARSDSGTNFYGAVPGRRRSGR